MVGGDKTSSVGHRIAGFEPICVGSGVGEDVEEIALVETELVRRSGAVVADGSDDEFRWLDCDSTFSVGEGAWAGCGCGWFCLLNDGPC